MKVVIWANFPSPHQADFYAALRQSGVDLRVVYQSPLLESRRSLGWAQPASQPAGESFLPSQMSPLEHVTDWRERIHVIPGYGFGTNRWLVRQLSRAGVPWVHWSENSQPSWRSALTWGLKKWYAHKVNNYALGAFAIGERATQDFVRWGIRLEKCAQLFYAIDGVPRDVERDCVTREFVGDECAFVYAGNLCHRKATLLLLEAFAKISAQSNSKLVLVGNGPQESTARRYLKSMGLDHQVLFRGVVPNEAIGSVIQCTQVLVLPSRFDGWGVVLNEGASAGLALIASDAVGAAYHLVEPGWNGFRVRAGSVGSLQRAMSVYASEPALAYVHGRNSTMLFQNFTPARNAERFITAVRGWQAAAGKTRMFPVPQPMPQHFQPQRAA
ncbi:MAG: glycosyltransferase family 4 protein [Bythopirellula sp.]|nr:glycosyltransferase family 4 protein [Bythopirellula sp.]